jgi:hypothetical protein
MPPSADIVNAYFAGKLPGNGTGPWNLQAIASKPEQIKSPALNGRAINWLSCKAHVSA